jgi:hypothetical protein
MKGKVVAFSGNEADSQLEAPWILRRNSSEEGAPSRDVLRR